MQDGVRPDDRSLWINQMMSLPCARIAPLLYPRLISLRKALDGSEPIEHLPDGMMLSSEGLEQGGIYLLENGVEAILHLDKNIDPALVHQIFGLSSYDDMLRVPNSLVLAPNDSPGSKALQDLLIKVSGPIPNLNYYSSIFTPSSLFCPGEDTSQLLPPPPSDEKGRSA